MKRFWHQAAAIRGADNLFDIMLDGRPVRLPEGGQLRVPQQALAQALAEEWQQAGGSFGANFTPAELPLTGLAGAAITRIAQNREATIAPIAAYGASDSLCYRADAPETLVIRQHHAWQPWLDWAARAHGAQLRTTQGVMPVDQPPEALAALRAAVAAHCNFGLAALGALVPALGSLVLGLAVSANALPAAEAHGLTLIDELHQESLWGEDAEAVKRRRAIAAELGSVAQFLALIA